jgi:copper chaperone CopZ
MKIKFKIQGIHCMGCVNLIKLTMEEHGFTDVDIDQISGSGQAQSVRNNLGEAAKDLESAFSELGDYSFILVD